jgi:hypothetical protein
MNSIIIDALDNLYNIKNKSLQYTFNIQDSIYNLEYVILLNNTIKKNYNIIGIRCKQNNYQEELFIWAWYLNLDNIYITRIKKLVHYGIEMDVKTLSNVYIKKLLITNKIKIKDGNDNQLLECIAFALYFTQANYFYYEEFDNYFIFYSIYD